MIADLRTEVAVDRAMAGGTLLRRIRARGLDVGDTIGALDLSMTLITTAAACGHRDDTYVVVHTTPKPPSRSPVLLRHLIGLSETRYVLGAHRDHWMHAERGRGPDALWRSPDHGRTIAIEYDTGSYGPRTRGQKLSEAVRLDRDLIWAAPSVPRLRRITAEAAALVDNVNTGRTRQGWDPYPGTIRTRLIRWDAGSTYL